MSQRKMKFRIWDMDLKSSHHHADPFGVGREVNQFTGLLDKNGQEIYEGDIVVGIVKIPEAFGFTDRFDEIKMGGEVFYDHTGFALKVIEQFCDPERAGRVNYFEFVDRSDGAVFADREIIGNIYKNPELLEVKK